MVNRAGKKEVTIATGATTSSAIAISYGFIVGIEFPASMVGTSVSFTVADLSTDTFKALYGTTGALFTVPVVASGIVQVNANDVSSLGGFIKVVSNATETSGATLKLITRDIS